MYRGPSLRHPRVCLPRLVWIIRPYARERIHPSGGLFVAAEGVELRATAHGAQPRRVNSRSSYANLLQLPAIGLGQVHVRPSVLPEERGHVRIHLVTALADPGTDRRMDVFGARP